MTVLRLTVFGLLVVVLNACSQLDHVAELKQSLRQTADLQSGTHIVKINQIFAASSEQHDRRDFIAFLQQFMIDHPTDPYRSYGQYLIARAYRDLNEPELYTQALQQALRVGPDVISEGESIHGKIIRILMGQEKDPYRSISLSQLFLTMNQSTVPKEQTLYDLGLLYETVGDYRQAHDTFRSLAAGLSETSSQANGLLQHIRDRLSLYDSRRDWGQPSLAVLLKLIKQAIQNRDYTAMVKLQAKANFFAVSWLQDRAASIAAIDFDIRKFSMKTVSFDNQLEANSNAQEAFLKTVGWSTYIPIWYLYFRKVDFPADPEYNGTWEWAGIYFGDTIQELPYSRGL